MKMSDVGCRMSDVRSAPRPVLYTRHPKVDIRHGFTLVEAALAMVIVSVMLAAGMSAAGAAARDRLVQAEIRQGQFLARSLMSEISQQRYADPSANTIAQWPGVSATDRSNWKH